MKTYEKILLSDLKEDYGKHEPLANIKKSMGGVADVIGNPRFKAEIQLTVTLNYFTAGVPIAPAALPAISQTGLPVYLFGLTDWQGGFLRSQSLVQISPNWVLLNIGIFQYNGYVVTLAALNHQAGDLTFQFIDTLGNIAFILVHCNNVAYGTFLNSFASDLITLNMIRYGVPIANVNQLINPLIFGYQTLFGKVSTDSIDPRTYVNNQTFNQQISDIPIQLPIDKNLMLATHIEFDCQQITFNLTVRKVDPLTHKYNNHKS